MKSAQEVYDKIQSCPDNKTLYAFAGEISRTYRERDKLKKQTTDKPKPKNEMLESGADLLEDKEALRVRVLHHLFQESEKGNAQASDKLAKLAGLTEQAQDITIEIVDYKNVIR
jgi:hypothetical protein